LAEAILYYVLRKKIKERKLVWVHLIFSLIGFVGMRFVIVLLSYMTYALTAMGLPKDFLWYAQLIGFWGCLLIGHTALILALVRIFSAKEPQQPNDDNDFLSEITV
jgi:amino acid transporter